LRREVNSNTQYYKDFLGLDFIHLELIVMNNASHENPKRRNKDVIENINRSINLLGIKGGVLGMYGVNHTSYDSPYSMINRLKNSTESQFHNKVTNFNVHYENSKSSYYKVIDIKESLLDRIFGKKAKDMEMSFVKAAGCSQFIMRVEDTPAQSLLKKNCDYLIYCNGGRPINEID
jgi:hypothetical protein